MQPTSDLEPANVENEKHGLTSMSNSVARGCPRELLRIVVAVIAADERLLAKMSSVAWQLIATRRLYRTKSAGGLECVMKSLCVGCI